MKFNWCWFVGLSKKTNSVEKKCKNIEKNYVRNDIQI